MRLTVPRGWARCLAAASCAGALATCTGGGAETAGTSQDTGAAHAGVAAAAGEPIEEVHLTPLDPPSGGWRALRSGGGRLFMYQPLQGGAVHQLARVDPATGRVPVTRDMPAWEGWTVSEHGVVVLEAGRRVVHVLDLDSLETRHRIVLPADARASIAIDVPRTGPFWLGLRRYDDEQLGGVLTRMGAVRLDLEGGTVEEIIDLPACGASPVTQLDVDRVVVGVACVNQIGIVDLDTGDVDVQEGFQVNAQMLAHDDAVWVRWPALGYLGRIRPGSDEVETLDLNAAGPTLSDLAGLVGEPDALWIVGDTADEAVPSVLHRIDLESFTVVGRAYVDAAVAFVDGTGYTFDDGVLSTFDPASVDTAAPPEPVRPAIGPPPEAEPASGDEAEVLEVATTVLDPAVPNDEVAATLGHDEELARIRTALLDQANTVYPGIAPRVTAVAVDGDTASVAYTFLVDDKIAFTPFAATFTLVDDTWVIARESVCVLAQEAAVEGC